MKKITRIILTVVLLFTFSLNVKAVTITTDNTKQGTVDTNSYLVTNTGTITINNVENDTFKGYKILDFYYNSSTDSITQEFTSEFKTFLATTTDYKNLTVEQYKNLTSGDTNNYSTQTNSTLDTLVSQYATYIASNNINGTALTTTPPPDAMTRGYATGTFPVGAYLVLPVNTPKVYAVMVGNIELQAENNSWNIQNATINAKVSSTSIVKTITGGNISNNKTYMRVNSIYDSTITVNVPDFPTNATNRKIYISEEYPEGFVRWFDFEEIDVENGSNFNEYMTIKDGDTTLTITKDKKIKNTNNDTVGNVEFPYTSDFPMNITIDTAYISSNTITITYKTKFNGKIGTQGNTIETEYSAGDPYDSGKYNLVESVSTTIYSYGIKIYTKDSSNNTLDGASYKLYSDASLNTEVGNFTTDNSISTITGLNPGTYYVKQTSSPSGASINNETFTVNIPDSQEGYVELTVTNSGTNVLPITGGSGTIMFIIIGLFIIGGAIVYYRFNKAVKKNAEV